MTDVELKIEALIDAVGRERYEKALRKRMDGSGHRAAMTREDILADILTELCVPAGSRGHAAICECVELLLEHPDCRPDGALCSEIYPGAADRLGMSRHSVEKGIRRAIEKGWAVCPAEVKRKYFGGVAATLGPKNGEFLAQVALTVRRRMTRAVKEANAD